MLNPPKVKLPAFLIALLSVVVSIATAGTVTVEHESPLIKFAVQQFRAKIDVDSLEYDLCFREDSEIGNQAFSIKTTAAQITVTGGDPVGLMYGCFELTELVELDYDLSGLDLLKSPDQANRGLKFNIPLDARCPSYDDTGDAAQKNIEHMWDFEFWREFFDTMAQYRYNTLSLWTPNGFQVMTQLPDYPELALDDVCVTNAIPTGKVGEWSDAGGVNNAVLSDLTIVKKINIEEKIAYWQKVFAYAKDRGIDIYWITWNIYTNGSYGKYGLTDEIDNPVTKAYYRQAINVFLQTYPTIKGIGITAGERMHVTEGEDVADAREKWLWETYGLGILDYKKEFPDREIPFLHRVWYTKFETVMKYWGNYPDTFDVGYKYVKARIYSSPNESPFIESLKKGLDASNLKCWWNLRNDDIYVYRWGDPDYTREFLSNLPKEITTGYHMGADGYVFGRVFSDKDPAVLGQLELKKHWYKFMLWGRLGYDASMDNDRFKKLLAKRYKTTTPELLFDTWQTASKIIPQINRFYFYSGDRHWHPEMSASRESFKYTPHLRLAKPMAGNGIINPVNYVEQKAKDLLDGVSVTPDEIARNFKVWSEQVLTQVDQIDGDCVELDFVKNDLKAFAWLGKYYGCKIEAAVVMEELAQSGNPSESKREQLSNLMHRASRAWSQYADISDAQYHTQMYSRVNRMDWKSLQTEVDRDVRIVNECYRSGRLDELLARQSPELEIQYPFHNRGKWVGLNTIQAGTIEIALFDARGELVDYYVHDVDAGKSHVVWEDLLWIPKGSYRLVLIASGKTATCVFTK